MESEKLIAETETYGGTSKNKEKQSSSLDIDEIFEENGMTCFLQVVIQLSTFYIFLVTVYNFVFQFFIGGNPSWRCVRNDTTFCQKNLNRSISIMDDAFSERCNLNRNEWEYVTKRDYSFVTEFDLICHKTSLAAFTSSSFYIGGVLGAIIAGSCADKYGRIYVLLFSSLFTTVCSIGSSYVQNIWHLVALNIIRGAGNVATFYITFVYQAEFSPPSYRSLSNSILLFGATCSFLLSDLLSNYERRWRRLCTYAALPSCLIIIILFLIPESPRWLLAMGRNAEAEAVIRKVEGKGSQRCINSDNVENKTHPQETLKACPGRKYSYLDLFRHSKVLKLTLVVMIIWFVLPVIYYSIALQSSNLGGNMYVAFALSTSADVPAYILSTYLTNKIGRKKTNLGGLLLSGLLMASMALVPRNSPSTFTINISISVLARCAVCTAFCGMYTWTLELFPTVVRSQAMSLCAVADRLGMFVVPFIIRLLQKVVFYLPNLIMCFLSIIACLVGLMLPETNKVPTKEKFEDLYDEPDRAPLLENPHT